MTIYNDLTKKELSEILDVIQSSIQCRAEEDIRVLLDRIRGLVCGDFGICGIGKGKDGGEEGLSAPPHIINLNYPMEWLQIYGANQLYYQDPIVINGTFQTPAPSSGTRPTRCTTASSRSFFSPRGTSG